MITKLRKAAARFAMGGDAGQSLIWQAILNHYPRSVKWLRDDVDSFYEEGYLRNPTVRACVDLIANTATEIEWKLMHGDEEVTGDAPDQLRTLARLLQQPNRREGWSEHIQQACINKLVAGEFFWEIVVPDTGLNRGRITQLVNASPLDVTVHTGDDVQEPVASYEVRAGEGRGGTAQQIPPERMIHGKFYDPRNYWRGLSPVTAAARAITRMNSYEEWNVRLSQNLGKTGGILSYDQKLSEEQIDQAKESFEDSHKGSPGNVMVTGALKEYIETGMTPADADWLDGSRDARELICTVYSVPKEAINLGAATFENRKEARKAVFENATIPLLRSIKDELNRALQVYYEDEDVHFEIDTTSVSALQEDKDKLHRRVMEQFTSGLISDVEAREALGYDPEPSEGTRFMPANMIPEAGELELPETDRSANWMEGLGLRKHYLLENGDS